MAVGQKNSFVAGHPATQDRGFILLKPANRRAAMTSPEPSFPASDTPGPHGLLFVATDVEPADDADFNRWYDREHVAERVRVPGFLSGARYVSIEGGRRYLGLEVLARCRLTTVNDTGDEVDTDTDLTLGLSA